MELLQKKYLRAERAVWEPEEPAPLSERNRKNRFSEKNRNSHHYQIGKCMTGYLLQAVLSMSPQAEIIYGRNVP